MIALLLRTLGRVTRHGYVFAAMAIAVSTAVFLLGRGSFAKGQWALLYLLIILLVASVAGTGPGLLAAVLAFLTWNFFFLPPYHTLQIHDPQDWLSLVAFLVVGVIVGVQAGRMREREARALAREQESAALNRLSAAVVSQTSTAHMAESCLKEVVDVLGAGSSTLFVLAGDDLESFCQAPVGACPDPVVAERARLVVREGGATSAQNATPEATAATVTAAEDGGLYVPVRSPSGMSGVLTVQARTDGRPYSAGDARLVTSLSNLVAAFLEREQLQAVATKAAAVRVHGLSRHPWVESGCTRDASAWMRVDKEA